MPTIALNAKGSRTLSVSEENLQTIRHYALFRDLVDSNGYVTEDVLKKLRLTVRSLIGSAQGDTRPLLDLCLDVLYHADMKALGLHNLILLYADWEQQQDAPAPDGQPA